MALETQPLIEDGIAISLQTIQAGVAGMGYVRLLFAVGIASFNIAGFNNKRN